MTPLATHVTPRSITYAKKLNNAYPRKSQTTMRYPEYNPLNSDHEFSATQNSSRTRRIEALLMSKEVQSANSMTPTESESKQADHPGPVLTDEEMVTNNFDIGFDDDLNAIFGVSAGSSEQPLSPQLNLSMAWMSSKENSRRIWRHFLIQLLLGSLESYLLNMVKFKRSRS